LLDLWVSNSGFSFVSPNQEHHAYFTAQRKAHQLLTLKVCTIIDHEVFQFPTVCVHRYVPATFQIHDDPAQKSIFERIPDSAKLERRRKTPLYRNGEVERRIMISRDSEFNSVGDSGSPARQPSAVSLYTVSADSNVRVWLVMQVIRIA